MNDNATLFYLFKTDETIEIESMTSKEAEAAWESGKRWLDVPQRTKASANELRALLSNQSRNSQLLSTPLRRPEYPTP
jgi:hypothetical protein